MHGPWGSDVKSVSKEFELPDGVSSCHVSWSSFGFNSRDWEIDGLYIDDQQVWAMQMGAGGGSTANSATVALYLEDYCYLNCQHYTTKYDNSVTVACSGTMRLRFESELDQGEDDEGWGFQNVVVTPGKLRSRPRVLLHRVIALDVSKLCFVARHMHRMPARSHLCGGCHLPLRLCLRRGLRRRH